MIEIKKPKISVEESANGSVGKFVIEPLERGYGTTVGNSLRRLLLSSLPGAAIIGIRIEGVDHEFSTIPGVVEDVTEIILNIKGVAIKANSQDREFKKVLTLVKNEEGYQNLIKLCKCGKDTVEIFAVFSHLCFLTVNDCCGSLGNEARI